MSDKHQLEMLSRVYETVLDRKANPKEGSYTTKLFSTGPDSILKKVGEESTEVIMAAKDVAAGLDGSRDHLRWEAADLLYHLMVALAYSDVTLDEVMQELQRRHK